MEIHRVEVSINTPANTGARFQFTKVTKVVIKYRYIGDKAITNSSMPFKRDARKNGRKNIIYSQTGTRHRHCTSIAYKNYLRPGAPCIVEHSPIISSESFLKVSEIIE